MKYFMGAVAVGQFSGVRDNDKRGEQEPEKRERIAGFRDGFPRAQGRRFVR